jgi:hypothetical protein
VSLRERHGALLRFVWVLCGGSLPKRARHLPPRVCECGVLSASRAPRLRFLLSTICGIHTPKVPCQCLHRLLHASAAREGGNDL